MTRRVGPAVLFFLAVCGLAAAADSRAFYRFEDELAEAVVEAAAPSSRPGGLRLTFDGTSGDGWTSLLGTGTVSVDGSALVFCSSGADSLVSPGGLNVEAAGIDTLRIRMRVTGASEVKLSWPRAPIRQPVPYRVARLAIPKQGEMTTYELRVAGLNTWDSVIDRLILTADTAVRIELEHVEFIAGGAAFLERAGRFGCNVQNDIRSSLYVHCPGRLTYSVTVPPRAAFSAGLSVSKEGAPVSFSLTAEADGKSETLLARTVSEAGKWEEVKADLSRYSGREIRLSLVSACESTGQVAVWANPAMFERRQDGAGRPNVVLYVVDCLRADHMDTGGYSRSTSPNIAAFAREGVAFSQCYATDTWTRPSIVSMLTGVDQLRHGVSEHGRVLPAGLQMLPGLLRSEGYETCAISENPFTPPDTVSADTFSQVAQLSRLAVKGGLRLRDLPELTFKAAAGFLERNADKPFFLYIHTMEPHEAERANPQAKPVYDPVEPYRSMWKSPSGQTAMDLYDGGIRYADDNFQRVLEAIDQSGLGENTVVILTADHGEAFGEHEGHHAHKWKPYNTLIHIPLVIRLPGRRGRAAVDANVQLIDVAPTLLELLGFPACGQFEGRSLAPLLEGRAAPEFDGRPVFSAWSSVSSVIKGEWKLMYDRASGSTRLFNMGKDPGELEDLAAGERQRVDGLRAELVAHAARQAGASKAGDAAAGEPTVGIDPEVEEQLKSLGYLDEAP